MRNLFDFIASRAKKRNAFVKSEEYHFFLENRHLLTRIPHFLNLYDLENDSLEVMRANIILFAYMNKVKMEEEVQNLGNYINTNKKNHTNFVNRSTKSFLNFHIIKRTRKRFTSLSLLVH